MEACVCVRGVCLWRSYFRVCRSVCVHILLCLMYWCVFEVGVPAVVFVVCLFEFKCVWYCSLLQPSGWENEPIRAWSCDWRTVVARLYEPTFVHGCEGKKTWNIDKVSLVGSYLWHCVWMRGCVCFCECVCVGEKEREREREAILYEIGRASCRERV